MSKLKGVKFSHEVVGANKALIAEADTELRNKLGAKFPMNISVGKGKDKVTLTVSLAE